jgi:hypothetical protein
MDSVFAEARHIGRYIAICFAWLIFSCNPSRAQGLHVSPARAPLGTSATAQEMQRAREILGLFLRRGQREPYMGEQITRLFLGRRLLESRQIIKHAGPGRHRIEYLSPPERRGEILLLIAGQLFNYKPGPPARILVGVAPDAEFQNRVRGRLRAILEGRVHIRVVGNEVIADRETAILELKSIGGSKRFWIDKQTGVRLKNEEIDPQGAVISTSYFTKIDYSPTFVQKDFHPASLPSAPHVPIFPPQKPLANVAEAQQQVAYTIREPAVPPGYRLDGVWVVHRLGERRVTILRYTDGVNTFALFQQPLPDTKASARGSRLRPRTMHWSQDVVHWVSGDRIFTLIGKLSPAAARQIVDSLS